MKLGPEDIVQIRILEWVRTVAPEVRYFHPANGGHRSINEARKFKALGVVAGVSDLVFLARGIVVFCEVKAARGSVSAAQRKWASDMNALGFHWFVAKGDSAIDDCRNAFRALGIKTREVTHA